MPMQLNEVSCLKKTTVILDDTHMALVGLFYHTADKKTNPQDYSFYRYEVYVDTLDNFKKRIDELKDPAKKQDLWRWPNPTWDPNWFMEYTKFNTCFYGAKFFNTAMKKALTWDRYVKKVQDGITYVASDRHEKRSESAKYVVSGYTDVQGNADLSILDKQTLLDHSGSFMWNIVTVCGKL